MNALKIEITYQQFEDFFVTAWEGGSSYWATVDTRKIPGKPPGEPWSTFLAKKLWDEDFKIPVFDAEEGDFLGYFTKKRFFKYASREPWALSELLQDNLDATSADVLFQLGTMGEVAFG